MKKKYADGGMFREGMPVPQDVDGASVTPGAKRPAMKRTAPAVKRAAPRGGMFREGMPVPQDIDGASVKAYKKGGAIDGIAKRGRTNCKMV